MHAVCGSTSGTTLTTTHDMSCHFQHCAVSTYCVCVVWFGCMRNRVLFPGFLSLHPPRPRPSLQFKSEKGKSLRISQVARARHLHAGQNRQWLTLSDYLDGRLDLRSITSAGPFTKVSIRAAVDARSTDPRVSTTAILSSPKYGAQLMRMQSIFLIIQKEQPCCKYLFCYI